MSEITRSPNTPVSNETGFLNQKSRSIRFVFCKRAFECNLERILESRRWSRGELVASRRLRIQAAEH